MIVNAKDYISTLVHIEELESWAVFLSVYVSTSLALCPRTFLEVQSGLRFLCYCDELLQLFKFSWLF